MAQLAREKPKLSFEQRRTRDRLILGFFIFRQLGGALILGWVVTLAFQSQATTLAWGALAAMLVYLGVAAFVVFRSLKEYKKRYGAHS
jgi:hypothetical protein